jgi:cell division protease FtsH
LQKNSEPVQKITIVPRTMGALGYVMQVPEEETYLDSKEELHDEIVILLGGRAAEELVFGSITTGASNDLEKATNIARSMVAYYGMSERFGNVQFESIESKYLDGRTAMNCADKTAAEIDKEVMAILKECYKEAYKLLKKNRDIIDKLAAHLIEKETITGREFMEIFCREKGIPLPPPKDNSAQFGKKNDVPTPAPAASPYVAPVPAPVFEEPKQEAVFEPEVPEEIEEVEEQPTMYGLTKEELDELNRVVEEEEAKEEPAAEVPAEEEPAEEMTDLNPEDQEFMDILEKRSEGKNDEVH